MDKLEWQKRLRAGLHTREVATVREIERLPDGLEARVADLERRVSLLEVAPMPIPLQPSNDPVPVPAGIGQTIEKVVALESEVATLRDQLNELGEDAADIGRAALSNASMMLKRVQALEATIANLPSDMMLAVAEAHAQLRS